MVSVRSETARLLRRLACSPDYIPPRCCTGGTVLLSACVRRPDPHTSLPRASAGRSTIGRVGSGGCMAILSGDRIPSLNIRVEPQEWVAVGTVAECDSGDSTARLLSGRSTPE